ncbi:MAG: hypothetical protein HFI09_00355 [Bacilli bacterium]|nr:hypothetical protein [Bacilli bacterium]
MKPLLLNDDKMKVLQRTNLAYVYPNPIKGNGRDISQVSSTSWDFHYKILQKWMCQGLIPDDFDIFKLLEREEIFKACLDFTRYYQSVIWQIKRVKLEDTPLGMCYCPSSLSEIERLYLRLWIEYFYKVQGDLMICQSRPNGDFDGYSNETKVEQFLVQENILDDHYIRSISKKYEEIF